MSIIFSASDLETLMIKVLFKNTKWFNKSELYKETKKYFATNQSELTLCHFLFSWEKLLANTNFITVKKSDNIEQIKILINSDIVNELNSSISSTNSADDIDFTIDIKQTILHMCNNKTIYFKSQVLQTFFKKNFPQYNSVYELLISNRQEIGHDNIICFINLYSDILKIDEIIDLIARKKYVNNKKENIQITPNTYLTFSSIYNFILSVSFTGIISMLVHKNVCFYKYFKWWQNK